MSIPFGIRAGNPRNSSNRPEMSDFAMPTRTFFDRNNYPVSHYVGVLIEGRQIHSCLDIEKLARRSENGYLDVPG